VRTSTGCTTKRAARDWLDVRAGKVASGERVPVKLDQILYDELHRDLLTRYQTVKKIRNLRDQKHRMERVLAHFGGWRAINVTATEIVKYVAKRQTEISPSTDQTPSAGLLNRELTTLKTVLRHGRDNGKLTQVPKIELLKEADPRAGVVEQADSDAIAQHLAEDARLAATIGFEVAWRVKSEVLTLTWDRVDLAEGCIRLDESHSKNGKSRRVYLSPVTTAMLVAQRGRMEALQQKLGRILPRGLQPR
jgi:integrase